jgi:phospholipid/cholesterol/gamma-HCH transport system substrate-binding protein
MLKYRGSRLMKAGFVGVVLVILVIATGLQPERLLSLATSVHYRALFADAGGLAVGNDVTVSGIKVGTVSGISLSGDGALVTLSVKGDILFGSDTAAHITTGTLLGERVVNLESAGSGSLHPMDIIPVARTSSPYSLTDAVSEFTTNASETSTESLNQSLETLSQTIDQIAPQLGPTFDSLTKVSQTFNGRNEALGDLLKKAANVTGVLSQRNQQVNSLILNANDLLGVLVQRRHAIVDLLANTSVVAKQLSGVVQDNEQKLAPTLDKLNSVIGVLEKNRDNIAKALPLFSKFEVTLGESVASGLYYQALVPNQFILQLLQPFIDYLWGFRTFDTASGRGPGFPSPMPRALFPWPYNGIPGGSR